MREGSKNNPALYKYYKCTVIEEFNQSGVSEDIKDSIDILTL